MRCDSLKELASVSTDVTFAQEFISRDGHLLLVKIVEDSNELVLHVSVLAHFPLPGWNAAPQIDITGERSAPSHSFLTLSQFWLKPISVFILIMIIDNTDELHCRMERQHSELNPECSVTMV